MPAVTDTAARSGGALASRPRSRRLTNVWIPAVLLVVAACGWWWAAVTRDDMSSMGASGMDMRMGGHVMSFDAFLVGWVAMMAAMMFPAIVPVVRLYAGAAARGNAAPVPVFVAGYLAVWSAIGIPAYFAWRELAEPIAAGESWVARLAACVLLAAAIYQLTPLKNVCLRHCRSPLSFFLHLRGDLRRPMHSLRAGVSHGLFCLGCCWALMAVLVAFGTMQLGWMLGLAALIFLEKNAKLGERLAQSAAIIFAVLAAVLLFNPDVIERLT
jgi:predicted metal-binding membrane protein